MKTMSMKKPLALLATLLLLASVFSLPAMAGVNAPLAGTPEYSLDGAGLTDDPLSTVIGDASNGSTITVDTGGTDPGNVTISGGKNIVLDLNGNDLTLAGGAAAGALSIGDGSLIIKNNGPDHATLTLTSAVVESNTLRVYGGGSLAIADGANVTVNVENTSNDPTGRSAISCDSSTVQVNGAVQAVYGSGIWANNATVQAGNVTSTYSGGVGAVNGATVTVGAVSAGKTAIVADVGCTVTAASATATGASGTGAGYGVEARNGSTVTVDGAVSAAAGVAIEAYDEGTVVKAASAHSDTNTAAVVSIGARIELDGAATGTTGIHAVDGYVSAAAATGTQGNGIMAYGGQVHVSGDVSGASTGIEASGVATVTAGSVTGGSYGIYAARKSLVQAQNATALADGGRGVLVNTDARVELTGTATGAIGALIMDPGSSFKAAAVTATGPNGIGLDLVANEGDPPSTILNAEVTGAVTGVFGGVRVSGGMRAQVGSASSATGYGLGAHNNAWVHVLGDVSCEIGVSVNDAEVQVDGSIRATQVGAEMYQNATVTVYGTITSPVPAQFNTGQDAATGTSTYADKIWDDSAPGTGDWQDWRVFTNAATPDAQLRVRTANGPFTDPDETDDPGGQQAQPTTTTATTTQPSPQTGDTATPLPYIAALLAGVALALCAIARKKRRA